MLYQYTLLPGDKLVATDLGQAIHDIKCIVDESQWSNTELKRSIDQVLYGGSVSGAAISVSGSAVSVSGSVIRIDGSALSPFLEEAKANPVLMEGFTSEIGNLYYDESCCEAYADSIRDMALDSTLYEGENGESWQNSIFRYQEQGNEFIPQDLIYSTAFELLRIIVDVNQNHVG